MAISIDARVSTAAGVGTSLSWSHTVGASANFLCVGTTTGSASIKSITSVVWDSGGANTNLSNTVNGTAAKNNDPVPNTNANFWYLVSPATGAKTIKVTPSASCELTGGSESLNGVATSSTFNAASPHLTTSANSANPTVTATTTNGEWVVDNVSVNLSALPTATVGSGQNQIYNTNNGSATSMGLMSDEAATGNTTVMDWTGLTSGHLGTGIVAVSIKAAASAADYYGGVGFCLSGVQ